MRSIQAGFIVSVSFDPPSCPGRLQPGIITPATVLFYRIAGGPTLSNHWYLVAINQQRLSNVLSVVQSSKVKALPVPPAQDLPPSQDLTSPEVLPLLYAYRFRNRHIFLLNHCKQVTACIDYAITPTDGLYYLQAQCNEVLELKSER
jgi:hypothetical protein